MASAQTCARSVSYKHLDVYKRQGLLLLQKQVHLVDVVAGGLVRGTVDGNTVPYLILNHQHTDFFKLLAQFIDVIADNPVCLLYTSKEGKSSPPQHFTEDTLLSAMETAGKEDMPEDA